MRNLTCSEPNVDLVAFNPPESLLLAVPPSLVRELCVIPLQADIDSITVAHPNDVAFGQQQRAKLEFVLNRTFLWVPTPRGCLQAAIDRLYADAFAGIINCESETPNRCLHRWRSLCPTNDVLIRYCTCCMRHVHLAKTMLEVQSLVGHARTVAVIDYPSED
jgi:hypothetical protein